MKTDVLEPNYVIERKGPDQSWRGHFAVSSIQTLFNRHPGFPEDKSEEQGRTVSCMRKGTDTLHFVYNVVVVGDIQRLP